jgi:hypothetical protein
MVRVAILIAFVLTGFGCAAPDPRGSSNKPKLSAELQAAFNEAGKLYSDDRTSEPERALKQKRCEDLGGKYEPAGGLIPGFGCYIVRPDANKKCTSSSQCTGECLSADPDPKDGRKAVGLCEPENIGPFGCVGRVENGRIKYTLCVD